MKMFKFVLLLIMGSMGVMQGCAFTDFVEARKKASQAAQLQQVIADEQPDAAPSEADLKKAAEAIVVTIEYLPSHVGDGGAYWTNVSVPLESLKKNATVTDLRLAVKKVIDAQGLTKKAGGLCGTEAAKAYDNSFRISAAGKKLKEDEIVTSYKALSAERGYWVSKFD